MPRRFRDIRGRRAFAAAMLSVNLVIAVLLGAMAAWQYTLAAEVAAFNADPDAPLSGAMMGWMLGIFFITLGHLVVYLTTVVAFLMWIHRACANAWALGGPVRCSPGWAVGWWFIPFANLFMPARCVLEIARASEPPDEEGESLGLPPPSRALLVGTWWAAWLGMNALSLVASTGFGNATTAPEVRTAATFGMLSYGVALLAGALAIGIVTGVSRRQLQLARELARRARAEADEEPPVARAF